MWLFRRRLCTRSEGKLVGHYQLSTDRAVYLKPAQEKQRLQLTVFTEEVVGQRMPLQTVDSMCLLVKLPKLQEVGTGNDGSSCEVKRPLEGYQQKCVQLYTMSCRWFQLEVVLCN